MENTILKALEFAKLGQYDGSHHKTWVIDQMVRALLNCPLITEEFTDYKGEKYTAEIQGKSQEYNDWIKNFKQGEDGPETYSWDEGIAP